MLSLSLEEQIVLSLSQPGTIDRTVTTASHVLSESSRSVDFGMVVRLAHLNQVTPILYKNIRGVCEVPEDILTTLKNSYLSTFYHNTRHLQETIRIISVLGETGVRSIPLKGSIASDVLLGNLGSYPTSDIDILVQVSDLGKTKAILSRAGYKLTDTISEADQMKGTYHLAFHNGTYVIEVHWNLVMRYFQAPPEFWWEGVSERSHEGMTILQLSPEKYLLYLIFRLYARAFMHLRYFVLITALINNQEVELDWSRLVSFSRRLRMERVTLFVLKLVHDLFRTDVPDEVLPRKLRGYCLLRDFIVRNLFRPAARTHLRMLCLTLLLDSPLDLAGVLLRKLFPSPSEIRFRYGLQENSRKTYPYYVLNPLLLMLRKYKR